MRVPVGRQELGTELPVRIPTKLFGATSPVCKDKPALLNRKVSCLEKILPTHNWVAVKELKFSYYIGEPYYFLYIPIMVT